MDLTSKTFTLDQLKALRAAWVLFKEMDDAEACLADAMETPSEEYAEDIIKLIGEVDTVIMSDEITVFIPNNHAEDPALEGA